MDDELGVDCQSRGWHVRVRRPRSRMRQYPTSGPRLHKLADLPDSPGPVRVDYRAEHAGDTGVPDVRGG